MEMKDEACPCIAKRTISVQVYAIFFSLMGPIVPMPCQSGHLITRSYDFYIDCVEKV